MEKKKIVLGTTLFMLLGIAAFLLGFTLLEGWEAVKQWFLDGNAWALFAAAIIYALLVLMYLWKKGDADGREGK